MNDSATFTRNVATSDYLSECFAKPRSDPVQSVTLISAEEIAGKSSHSRTAAAAAMLGFLTVNNPESSVFRARELQTMNKQLEIHDISQLQTTVSFADAVFTSAGSRVPQVSVTTHDSFTVQNVSDSSKTTSHAIEDRSVRADRAAIVAMDTSEVSANNDLSTFVRTGHAKESGVSAVGTLRQGWLDKSPKSYWLRRHSDSLLVADSGDQKLSQRARAETCSGEDVIDSDVLIDRSLSTTMQNSKYDIETQNDRLGPSWKPTARLLPSSSSFDSDDVFDDEIVEDRFSAPKRISPVASSYASTSPASADASPVVCSTGSRSPSFVFPPSSATADEIAVRLEQLQSAEWHLPRGQRLSGSAVDEAGHSALPRILEERDEVDPDRVGLSVFRHANYNAKQPTSPHHIVSAARDFHCNPSIRSPSQFSSSLTPDNKLKLPVDLINSPNHVTQGESPADYLMTTTMTRRPLSAANSTSGRKHGRNQTSSPSAESTSSMSSAGAGVGSTSGNKLHRCAVCRRSFARSDMLERHARLHTGVRPYSCRLCSQVFSRSDHLTTHLRTHTGEKPYQCPRCSYSASRRDMVTRHLRVHIHDNHVDGGTVGGGSGCSSPMQLSPLTVGSQLTGRRRQMRPKRKDRPQLRVLVDDVDATTEADPQPMPSSSWSPQPLKPCVSGESSVSSVPAASCSPSVRRNLPWMSPIQCADPIVKAAVDSWTRSMVAGCLASPSPIRSPVTTSFRRSDEAAIATGGLSLILARGSTGSTDSYSSPGCCSIPGSGDTFEFGGVAEGSPDVFWSPAAAARQTLKFLWPLVPQSAQADTGTGNTSSYDSSCS